MSAAGHVLVVEDETLLAEIIGDYLAAGEYSYVLASTGQSALAAMNQKTPDLVLLDLMLPDMNGIDLFQRIRAISTVPVIMVTARSEEEDRLRGLQLGADDYVCKPFSPRELVARVGAVLRRAKPASASAFITLSEDGTTAQVGGVSIELTVAEHRLLAALCQSPGRLFSRQQLLDLIYDQARPVTDRTIDTHVKNIRRKLAEAGLQAEWIRTVYGAGYRLDLGDGPS